MNAAGVPTFPRMRDLRHPVLGVLVAVVALASAFMLPATASAAASGSITVSAGTTNLVSTSMTYTSAGTSSRQIERHDAPLVSGTCGTYGAWAAVSAVDPASPWVDTTTQHGNCYQWRLRLTDTATTPVTTYATSASVVKIDRGAPGATIDATPVGPFTGSKTLTGTISEATTAVTSVAVRYTGPATGTICASATKTLTTWTCAWSTTLLTLDGTYTIEATATDSAGNQTVATRAVLVDNHGPVASLAGFTALTGAVYQYAVGSTIYVNSAYSGSFTIDVAATDDGSGMDRVVFPAITSGWSPAGGTDNTAPSPYSMTYSWTPGALNGGVKSATAYDLVGKTSTVSFTITNDTGAPASGTISWAPSGVNGAITFSRGTDAGSGLGSGQLQRREAPDTGTCGVYGPWGDVGPPVTVSPYIDTTVQSARCYEYRLRNVDNVGNAVNVIGSGTLRNVGVSDTTAPIGSISATPLGPFRGATSLSGTAADAGSGVASVSIDVTGAGAGHLCTIAGAGAAAWTCAWDTTTRPDGVYTIEARVTDVAGNVSSGITRVVVVDNTGPVTSFASFVEGVNAGAQHAVGSTMYVNPAQSGSFLVNIAASDAGSGVDHLTFPTLGPGWMGGGPMNGAASPYGLSYDWTSGVTASGAQTVTVHDLLGNTSTATFTIALDTAPPAGGTATAAWDNATDHAVVTYAMGTDAASGLGSWQLQRRSTPRVAGVCGSFGSWTNVGAMSAASPFADTTTTSGTCYEYRLAQSDQVDNVSFVPTGQVWAPPAPGLVLSTTSIAIGEDGTTDSIEVSLTRQPTSAVTVAVVTDTQTWASQGSLLFTTSNWNVPQLLDIGAVDDFVDEIQPHAGLVSMLVSSADTAYASLPVGQVTASITDNDVAGAVISGSIDTLTEGGIAAAADIVLTSEPTADVTVTLNGGSQVTATPSTLVFTPANWATPQAFTVAAIDDALVEGSPHAGTLLVTGTSSDPSYGGLLLTSTSIAITDNDVAPPADLLPPIGGAVTMTDTWSSAAIVQVPFVVGSDADSGIASWRLQRRLGTLAGDTCSSWGAWADRGSSNPVSPYADTTTNATCTQYRLVVLDAAGNSATWAAPGVVRVDRVTPYGAFDALASGAAHGVETIQGMAIDAVSTVQVSVGYDGAASGDVCVHPPIASGRWSCAWDTTGLPNGSYLLTATIVDSAGNTNLETMSVSVANTTVLAAPPQGAGPGTPLAPTTRDEQPPVVTRPALPAVAWGTTALLRWRATDESTTASSVVEQRSVNTKGTWGPWQTVTDRATDTLTVPLPRRVATTCFRVVAADAAGNTATSSESCANVPVDDRELKRSAGWVRSKGRGALKGTLSTTSRGNASLSLQIGDAQEITLVAATCPRCGTVRVMSGRSLLGTVSLRSRRAKARVALKVPKAPGAGMLRIVVVAGTGTVQVDGVIVDRGN